MFVVYMLCSFYCFHYAFGLLVGRIPTELQSALYHVAFIACINSDEFLLYI